MECNEKMLKALKNYVKGDTHLDEFSGLAEPSNDILYRIQQEEIYHWVNDIRHLAVGETMELNSNLSTSKSARGANQYSITLQESELEEPTSLGVFRPTKEYQAINVRKQLAGVDDDDEFLQGMVMGEDEIILPVGTKIKLINKSKIKLGLPLYEYQILSAGGVIIGTYEVEGEM